MKRLSIKMVATATLSLAVMTVISSRMTLRVRTTPLIESGVTVHEYYSKDFIAQEQAIHKELKALVNINTCHAEQQKLSADFRRYASTLKTDKINVETRKLVENIGKDFNISPRDFVIKTRNMGASPACMEECILYINETLLKSYSNKAQRFVIAHEFSHMINHDGAFMTVVRKQLDMKNTQHKELFNKLSRFQEARADMMASTKHIDYAQGGLEFFKTLHKRYGDSTAITHPKSSDRITAHNTFINVHKQHSFA